MSITPSKRLNYIDSLRGLAALLVAYFHYLGHMDHAGLIPSAFEQWIVVLCKDWFDLGKFSVVVFFAISGFVIPYSIYRTKDEEKGNKYRALRSFCVSRLFRLYPVYWLSIPLAVVLLGWEGKAFSTATIAVNFTMLQQFLGIENIQGLYWTLQIELVFYFLCVVLFLAGWLDKKRALFVIACLHLALALVLAIARYMLEMKFPVALALALGFMFWGSIWRNYLIEGCLESRRYGLIYMGFFFALMPIIALLAYNTDMGFGETWYRYTSSYYAAAIVLLVCTTKFRLEGKFLSWLGRISYSVYLFHSVVRVAVTHGLDAAGISLPGHVIILLSLIAALAFSHLTYHLIEQPAVTLGRRINKWMDAQGW